MTAQKPEFFEMLMIKRLSQDVVNSIGLDWRRPRIIFIAENFSKYDTDTADVISSVFRVELMKYRAYEGSIFELLSSESERQSGTVTAAPAIPNQDGGVIEYSVEGHRAKGSAEIQALFDDLRSRVLALDRYINLSSPSDLYYVMGIIEQSYNNVA